MPAPRMLGLAAVALALSACSEPKPKTAPVTSTRPPTTVAPQQTSFRVDGFHVEAVDLPSEQFEGIKAKLTELLDRYLTTAVLTPLRSGQPAGDLSTVFGGSAFERVKEGADRAALVDEGLPKAEDVRLDTAVAAVVVLAGPSADNGVAVAAIRVTVSARVGASPLTVQRGAELTMEASGDDWRISGYDVVVTRDTANGTTTTRAR